MADFDPEAAKRDAKKMTVPQLRDRLSAAAADTSGRKADLVARWVGPAPWGTPSAFSDVEADGDALRCYRASAGRLGVVTAVALETVPLYRVARTTTVLRGALETRT